MPKIPVKPFRKQIPNTEILNAIRKNASLDYKSRIPEATKANIRDTIDHLWDGKNAGARNEFIDALINQVGLIIARTNNWTNPLAEFKRGMLTFGNSIEEIQTGLVPSYVFDPDRDELERAVFGQAVPNVQASIHKVNRQEYYKITINEDLLRRAFFEENGLATFIAQLMNAPTVSDNYDEFNLMCSLFGEYNRAEGFFNIKVPDIGAGNSTEAQAKTFLREVRGMAQELTFLSPYYNASGLHVSANINDLVLFMTPRAQAAMDVNALAAAFNVTYAEFLSRIVIIPETSFDMPGTQAILTTSDFFVIADSLYETRSVQNPAGLYNNYFLHHHQILSVSRFVPAVRFSTDDSTVIEPVTPSITSVSAPVINMLDAHGDPVNPAEDAVERGGIYQVFASAVDTADIMTDVNLELGGAESSFTRLTNTGTLAVSLDEKATSLKITATSLLDESKTASVDIPVTGEIAQLWPNPSVLPEPVPPVDPGAGE